MIYLRVIETNELLGIFSTLAEADAFHDEWSDRFGYDHETGMSLAPSCSFSEKSV